MQPTVEEIDQQLTRMCRHRLFKTNQAGALLRFLIEKQRSGFYVKNSVTGTQVLDLFFKQRADMSDSHDKGRQAVGDLRRKITKYYRDLPEDAEDTLYVSVPVGTGTAYEPKYDSRKTLSLQQKNEPLTFIGNNFAALEEFINLIPLASVIEDTAVRWHESDREPLFTESLMERFTLALRNNTDLEFRSITGPTVDTQYTKVLSDAFAHRPNKLKAFKLLHTAPVMNFTIFYFKEALRRERVLFGYGKQTGSDSVDKTAVFSTELPELVKEYKRLFEVFQGDRRTSRTISLEDYDFHHSRIARSDILASFDVWPNEIGERIQKSRKSVKICASGWSQLETYERAIEEALESHGSVTIAVWKPSSPFVKARSRTLTNTKNTIHHNFSTLGRLKKRHPSLEVVPCGGWGSVSMFWIDDDIYFGMYWNRESTFLGPYFLCRAKSRTGRFLQEEFARMSSLLSADNKSREASRKWPK